MAFTPTNSKIYLIPLEVFRTPVEFDRLAVDVATAQAGKVARMGVYLSTPNGLPDERLLQTAEVSLASVAVVQETVALTLPPGRSWLAFAGDSTTAALTSVAVGGFLARTAAGSVMAKLASATFTYAPGADLPAAISAIAYITSDPPLISLRAK